MSKNKKILKILVILLLILSIIWFSLVMYNFSRVKNEKRPIMCFFEVKDIESEKEYSKTCYGLLYKYREYYYNSSDEISAREFTLFFKEFAREVDQNEA